jgi:hypothetical protein
MLKLARQGALSKPWRRRRQGPTCIREQVNNWPRSIGERDGAKPGQNRPGPTGPSHSGPGSCPSFALGACLFIVSASAGRHIDPFIREPPRRMISTGRKPPPPRVLELPRRWLRPCPSHHGWPCVVKPWWSSEAATWIRQVVCTFNIRWCNHILSFFDPLRVMLIHMCCYHMPLVGLDRNMIIGLVLRIHRSSVRTEVYRSVMIILA